MGIASKSTYVRYLTFIEREKVEVVLLEFTISADLQLVLRDGILVTIDFRV